MGIRTFFGNWKQKKANNKQSADSGSHRVDTLLSDKSPFVVTEAYKAARTNLIFALGAERAAGAEKTSKKIIVTSASPGEGKTTTCLNLAIAFAQTEARVLIIDADLRKPRVYRHLMIERQNGLSDVLCGLITLDEAIKKCPEQGIDCITSGQIPPNPAELLSSIEMKELLDELSTRYDYIFIDTPPVTVVTEAAAMAKYANGVVIIIRQNYTIHESIQRAIANLEFGEAKILGFILNGVEPGKYGYSSYRRYGYRKHKSYGYNYGYGNGYNYGEYGGYTDNGANGGYGYGTGYGYGSGYGSSYGSSYGGIFKKKKNPDVEPPQELSEEEKKKIEKKRKEKEKFKDKFRSK